MSGEQLSQVVPIELGKFSYYRIGETTIKQLKDAGLIANKDYGLIVRKKPDGIVIYQKSVKAIVECKSTSELRTQKQVDEAIDQSIDIAKGLCKLLIVTDNHSKTQWINPFTREQIKSKSGQVINKIFDAKLVKNVEELEYLIDEIDNSISETNSQLREERIIDPSALAARMWQTIWAATGKSPVKCLYNVVELFIFKFLSDLKVLNENYSFSKVYEISKTDPPEALSYYARNSRIEIGKLFPKGNDGTTIINGTIFVDDSGSPNLSQATLFTRSLKHLFDYGNTFGSLTKIDKQFKTKLYETFLKQEVEALGQYFTPRKLVQSIIRMSGLSSESFQFNNKRICDPFCGVGGFPLEILNMNEKMKDCFTPKKGKISVPFAINGFDKGFEREDERTIILAKANMLIYLSDIIFKHPQLTEEFANQFNNTFRLFNTNLGTFGYVIENEDDKYDYILSNPPYVTSGSSIIKEEIGKNPDIKKAFPINAQGLEGLGMEWIINSLKKGGQSYVVIPDGILNRVHDKRLRDFILNECYLDAIISLPVKTFFANSKKTFIIVVTKKHDREKDVQHHPVFTFVVSNIGEALTKKTRDDISENDLPEMEEYFKRFKAVKDENIEIIKKIEKESKRCKIQPIEVFNTSPSWIIDNWWTEKEKIDLGIEEEKKVVSISEFKEILLGVTEEISSYIQELEDLKLDFNEV